MQEPGIQELERVGQVVIGFRSWFLRGVTTFSSSDTQVYTWRICVNVKSNFKVLIQTLYEYVHYWLTSGWYITRKHFKVI